MVIVCRMYTLSCALADYIQYDSLGIFELLYMLVVPCNLNQSIVIVNYLRVSRNVASPKLCHTEYRLRFTQFEQCIHFRVTPFRLEIITAFDK